MASLRKLIFDARTEKIGEITAFVLEGARNLPDRRRRHLELALEESLVNICSYAYEVPPGEVEVSTTWGEDHSFTVELADNGVPFDPLAVQEPDTSAPLDNRNVGGLGVLLIRRVMDEVHYSRRNGKNILALVVRMDDD